MSLDDHVISSAILKQLTRGIFTGNSQEAHYVISSNITWFRASHMICCRNRAEFFVIFFVEFISCSLDYSGSKTVHSLQEVFCNLQCLWRIHFSSWKSKFCWISLIDNIFRHPSCPNYSSRFVFANKLKTNN